MLQELKKKSLKKNLAKILVALALAVGLLWGSDFGAFKAIGGPKDLYALDADDLQGQYVTADIYFIYDWYAYTETTNESSHYSHVTEKEYIISTDDVYLGVAVPGGMIDDAEAVLDDSDAYYYGDLSELTRCITVTGTIQRMDSKTLDFYHKVVGYDGMSNADRALFTPLVLKVNCLGRMPEGLTWLMTAAAAAALCYAIWILATSLTGGYQKSIKAYCKASESPEVTLEELDQFYQNTEPVNGVRVGKWILFETKGKDMVLDANDVVWAYLHTVNHSTNGVPTGKTFGVVVRTRNRKKYEVAMKSEAAARDVLNTIARDMPRTVLGYTAKLERFYNQRFQDFLRLPDDEALRAEAFGQ